jgi:exonuclease VII small subunit
LADIFDRHEKLVRLAQACLAEARQQLALVAGIRRKEGVLF